MIIFRPQNDDDGGGGVVVGWVLRTSKYLRGVFVEGRSRLRA